ncbi:MAG: hypothetical protein Q8P68_00270 [Candidatus Peregrinibacteria bacterium]|nr:hypothetical protein [Candidatus Peregrinibacteria bacterium]
MKTNSLFIGRFQPFHIGHLADIKSIIAKGEHCIIAIAAANKVGTWRNPLAGAERENIIKETLKAESLLDPKGLPKGSYEVHQLIDIDDDDRWVQHVIDSLPPFSKIYSGSEYVRGFFVDDERFETLPIKMIHDENDKILCATSIRKEALKSENYKKYLHSSTIGFLDELAFRERLVKILGKV